MNADTREAIREIAIRWLETPEGEAFLYDITSDAYDEGYENGLARSNEESDETSD